MTASTIKSETAAMLRLVAEPAVIGEHISQQIYRAGRRCQLSAARARKLWYEQAKVSGEDLAAILRTLSKSENLVIAYMESQSRLLESRMRSLRDDAP